MCFSGVCKYERSDGECKGKRDWSQPDAACNTHNDFEVEDKDDIILYKYPFYGEEE